MTSLVEAKSRRPRVSVVIPTYNRSGLVAEAIRSVLAQTYRNIEIVVVDDGSRDGTRQTVERFRDDRSVRYLFQENRGDTSARNRGIRACSSRYVAFLDSDDLWAPTKLARQVEALEADRGLGFAYCTVVLSHLDENGRVLREELRAMPKIEAPTVFEEQLYRHVLIGTNSALIARRDVLHEVGLFDEDLICGDQDLVRRLTLRHRFHVVDEPLVWIRKHGDNLSPLTPDRAIRGQLRQLDKIHRDTPVRYRHHLPRVTVKVHLDLGVLCCRGGRVLTGCRFLLAALWGARRCPFFLGRLLVADAPRLRRFVVARARRHQLAGSRSVR
jgi:glycosyltransferase involved in cell wall biosynthesis